MLYVIFLPWGRKGQREINWDNQRALTDCCSEGKNKLSTVVLEIKA